MRSTYLCGIRKLWMFFCVVLFTLPGLATAQIVSDPPSLSMVSTDKASVRLLVTAGASGAPRGFVLEWLPQSQLKGQEEWRASDSYASCEFFGTPTLTVGPSTSYALGPYEAIEIEIGDLFDETGRNSGSLGELPEGMSFAFRAFAGTLGAPESEVSATLYASTLLADVSCVLTQGYWKNHPASWPVAQLMLGTVSYTQAQLLDILQTPARGNGLVFLAHQLIAAKLNATSGAFPPGTLIADADALIGGLVVPPVGSGFLAPSSASALTEQLDRYNSGHEGVPHCEPVSTQPTTWSHTKQIYR